MKIYGYIRVSAGNQNEDRQLIAMKNAQVPRNNIFLDKQSGCKKYTFFQADSQSAFLSYSKISE